MDPRLEYAMWQNNLITSQIYKTISLRKLAQFVSLKAKGTVYKYHNPVDKVVSRGAPIHNLDTALHVYWNWTVK